MITLQRRLDCPHSFAMDDSPDLMCDYGGKCTGDLYDCCLWNLSFEKQMEIIYENRKDDRE